MLPWQFCFIQTHALTERYIADAAPIVKWVRAELDKTMGAPFCLGLNGAQGSGKSTLAAYLAAAFERDGISVAVVSIDDFYLSPQKRNRLANTVHPLLKTRGVPGTHSILQAINAVELFKKKQKFTLPRFDKSKDQPFKTCDWLRVETPPNILIFEGWCVGLKPEPITRLSDPVNSLESKHDGSGVYRHFVNACLAEDYQQLFTQFDKLIYLDVKTFDRVYQWRLLQERQLRLKSGLGMSDNEIAEFIKYFERLTLWGLASLPEQSDLTIHIDNAHRFHIDIHSI
jgi:D-glycerate 3-kinase